MVNPLFMVEHRGINNIKHDIYIDNHSVTRGGRPVKPGYKCAPARSSPLSPFSRSPCLASSSFVETWHVLGLVFRHKHHLGPCVFADGVLVRH